MSAIKNLIVNWKANKKINKETRKINREMSEMYELTKDPEKLINDKKSMEKFDLLEKNVHDNIDQLTDYSINRLDRTSKEMDTRLSEMEQRLFGNDFGISDSEAEEELQRIMAREEAKHR